MPVLCIQHDCQWLHGRGSGLCDTVDVYPAHDVPPGIVAILNEYGEEHKSCVKGLDMAWAYTLRAQRIGVDLDMQGKLLV